MMPATLGPIFKYILLIWYYSCPNIFPLSPSAQYTHSLQQAPP